jgi:hypothetical protein
MGLQHSKRDILIRDLDTGRFGEFCRSDLPRRAHVQAHLLEPASRARHEASVQKELLRHANIQTTLNIYTRAISEEKRKAASEVAQKLYEFVPAPKLKSA